MHQRIENRLNNRNLDFADYNEGFPKIEFENHHKYTATKHKISLCSKNRDRNKYPKSTNYRMILTRTYKNVISVELDFLALPQYSNSDPYYVLQLEEIKPGIYETNDDNVRNALAMLPNRLALGNFNYIVDTPGDTRYVKDYIKTYIDTPMGSLDKLTVSLKKSDGNLIDFGNDLIPTNKPYDFTFVASASPTVITTTSHDLQVNDDIIITNSDNTLNAIHKVTTVTSNDIFEVNVDTTGATKLTGRFTRTGNSFSKVTINTVVDGGLDSGTGQQLLTITTANNHNLQLHDHFLADGSNNSQFNTYHVVHERTNDTQFKITQKNIQLDENGLLTVDDIEENNDSLIAPLPVNIQLTKFGDADPSIQSIIQISITTRDEDDGMLRSTNVY